MSVNSPVLSFTSLLTFVKKSLRSVMVPRHSSRNSPNPMFKAGADRYSQRERSSLRSVQRLVFNLDCTLRDLNSRCNVLGLPFNRIARATRRRLLA